MKFNRGITNLNYLLINETNEYNLITSIATRENSENIDIELPLEKYTILGGIGSLPISIYIKPGEIQRNFVIPLSINYSVLDKSLVSRGIFSNPHEYNKKFYIIANTIPEKPLSIINFSDIPQEYIAIFVGAIFTFFIPSALVFLI